MNRDDLQDLGHAALATLRGDDDASTLRAGRLTVNGKLAGEWADIGLTQLQGEVIATDPETGHVFVIASGLVEEEWTATAILMRFSERDLIDAEVVLGTEQAGPYGNAGELREGDLIYSAPIAPHRRAERSALQSIAQGYWEACAGGEAGAVAFDRRCDIYRNGAKFTNTLKSLLWPESKLYTPRALVEAIGNASAGLREVRFPVVDAELGLVASIAVLDQRDDATAMGQSGGTAYVACLMKIVDRSIRCVDEIHCVLPIGAAIALSEEAI